MSFLNKWTSDSLPVRNETGTTLARGRLVAIVGFSLVHKLPLIDYADKDDSSKRPAIGVLSTQLLDQSNGFVLEHGRFQGLDTSTFSLTDQLVLGNNGLFSRPPPDQDPFTGEIQGIGSVGRVDSSNGEIILCIQDLDVLTADGAFAIENSIGRGLENGGEISIVSGRTLQISAGVGFVTDGSGNIKRLKWNVQNILIPANSFRFIFINNTGTVVNDVLRPDIDENVILGNVRSNSTNIVLISSHNVATSRRNADIYLLSEEAIGPLTVSGGRASINGINNLKLDIDSATFWMLNSRHQLPATISGVFVYWYRNGSGDWNTVPNSAVIDPNNYDNNTGTLAVIPSGLYKKDLLFIAPPKQDSSQVQYHVIYGQETFSGLAAAIDGNVPLAPDEIIDFSLRSTGIIVQKSATSISTVTDLRPFLGQQSPNTTSVTDHGNLGGLSDDDHLQYILVNGTRAFSGNINAGGNSLTNINLVDGRDVSVDGTKLDTVATNAAALTSSAPVDVTKSVAVVGVATDAARADHKHNIATAVPSTQTHQAVNTEGTSTSLARADHIHAFTAPGAPADVTKAAASAGVATTFARADHKHDITTATVATIGTANSEGTATSLARSDHIHDHGSQPLGVGTNHAVATVSTAGFMSATDKVKINNAVIGPTSSTDTAVAVFSGVNGQVVKNTLVTIDGSGNVTASGTYNGVNVASHATRHNDGGADELTVQSLGAGATASGLLLETSGTGTWNLKSTTSISTTLTSSIQEATGTITTTSTTDVLVTSMTVTPASGTYLVWFTGSVNNTNNDRDIIMSIYSGGSQVASSERLAHDNNAVETYPFACVARVTVNGSQAIEGRWRTSANTASMFQRNLAILKVS